MKAKAGNNHPHRINNLRRKNGGNYSGPNNGNWKGGISHDLKYRSIRRRARLERLAGRPRPDTCEICGGQGKIYFDHDHRTGLFRGWLCAHCNLILGHAKDNAELLRSLINYLER